MMQQKNLLGKISRLRDIYEKCMPNVALTCNELPVEVYKDCVLSSIQIIFL